MPNQLWFSKGSKAEGFYRGLDAPTRNSLDSVLDAIRDDPTPDGITKTSILMAPVVIYYHEDDHWKVSYGLSYYPNDAHFGIGVFAIAQK